MRNNNLNNDIYSILFSQKVCKVHKNKEKVYKFKKYYTLYGI